MFKNYSSKTTVKYHLACEPLDTKLFVWFLQDVLILGCIYD